VAATQPPDATAAQAAPCGLEVRTPPGRIRGVYATRPIAAGEVVEAAPTLLIDESAARLMDQTPLAHYYFEWSDDGPSWAFLFGFGMLYNHSFRPNLDFHRDYDARTIIFTALRDIAPGEQLTINYNGFPDDGSPLWFEPREEC
jgi:SET domain-containing protein